MKNLQAFYYFGSLLNMNTYGKYSTMSIGELPYVFMPSGGGDSCTCHKGSIVNPYCDYSCPEDAHSNRGCGFFFLWPCNGKHLR